MSWIGTGRLIFSLNYTEADFEAVAERVIAAAEAMQRGGWWEVGALGTDRAVKRRILREMLGHYVAPWISGSSTPDSVVGARPLDARL